MRAVRTTLAFATLALLASFGAGAQVWGELSLPQAIDVGAVRAEKTMPSKVDSEALKTAAIAARDAGLTVSGECAVPQKVDVGACKRPAVAPSALSRAEVRAEAATANLAGLTHFGETTPYL